jgi:hypothetical protein
VSDAGATGTCGIAASCLCSGDLPARGVLEATVTTEYQAQITATFGDTTGFSIGDSICVNQSAVGATILVPIASDADAAHVVLVPDAETCTPNFAYTVQLDDAGRPLGCNAGNESSLTLTTQQAIDALRAQDCAASLGAVDARWSTSACVTSAGCALGGGTTAFGALGAIALVAWISSRRRRSRSSSARRATTGEGTPRRCTAKPS